MKAIETIISVLFVVVYGFVQLTKVSPTSNEAFYLYAGCAVFWVLTRCHEILADLLGLGRRRAAGSAR